MPLLALFLLAFPGAQPGWSQARPAAEKASSRPHLLFVGTYTQKDARGIYAWRFDSGTGRAETLGLVARTENPSFLALHPSGSHLFAVNELGRFHDQRSGAVSAFGVDAATGHLTPLNQVASGGADPCFITVDAGGRNALVANYSGGSVGVLPIAADGRLGEASALLVFHGVGVNPARQEAPHAHSVNLSPDGRHALVADLGMDLIRSFRFDAQRDSLEPGQPPFARSAPGAGPRHLAFHPDGRRIYVFNELQSSVTTYEYTSATGALLEVQTVSTLPEGFKGGNTGAEILVHPGGRFAYASNRGHDSIAVFSIDERTGSLSLIQHIPSGGRTPRSIALDPGGKWLLAAHQDTDNIAVFRIDPASGRLALAEDRGFRAPTPVCLVFRPQP